MPLSVVGFVRLLHPGDRRHLQRRQPDRRPRRPGDRAGDHGRRRVRPDRLRGRQHRSTPTTSIVHHVPRSGELAVLLSALVGAGLGFLWFNAPPAMVFMGDTGSLSIGGALGGVAVVTKHEIVLAIVGGLFVLETVSVIVQVLSFKMDRQAHLPHGAAASSFRAEGLGRAHHRLPLLDHRRHPVDGRPRHPEAEVSG